jgi:hypothetical protein
MQRHEWPSVFRHQKYFSSLKNALAYYNAGAVALNAIVLGQVPILLIN